MPWQKPWHLLTAEANFEPCRNSSKEIVLNCWVPSSICTDIIPDTFVRIRNSTTNITRFVAAGPNGEMNSWRNPKMTLKCQFSLYRKISSEELKQINQVIVVSSLLKVQITPKNLYLFWVTPQIGTFVKQKSNVVTFWSSSPIINFIIGKIPDWILEGNLDFLQQICFSKT